MTHDASPITDFGPRLPDGRSVMHLFVKKIAAGIFQVRDRSRHAKDPLQIKGGFYLTEKAAQRELNDLKAGAL